MQPAHPKNGITMKKIILAGFSLITTLGWSPRSFAQLQPAPKEKIEHCATMHMDSLLRKKYPALGDLTGLEYEIQRKMNEIELRQANARTEAEILTIPVVVHIVHRGEAVGQGTNISAAQVQSQLDVLNEDFRRKLGTRGFNSNPVGADMEIEFCLAALGPNGSTLSEKGIHRYNGNKASWTREEIEGVLKPATSWDPDKYFNVWVVPDLASTTPGGTLLGYAQFPVGSNLPGIPSGGPASTDGVVVRVQGFGSSDKGTFPILNAAYSKGRTLTHETGHWLGLRHIWGDGDCSADDFCTDTPNSSGPSEGCPTGRNSCGGPNQIENYMDYTNDVCMNVFTQCQKNRMRAVMEVSPRRRTLLSSNVCGTQVAARPVANFNANKVKVLRGGSVNFNDLSANFPTSWNWTFEGGEPATSTDRNPVVVYNAAGLYDVSLIVTNANGSDTLTRENFIEVSNEGLCNNLSNFNGTPTLLRPPVENLTRGYVAGHNNLKHSAKAEYFNNEPGYANLSGALLRFGLVKSNRPNAVVKVSAWNARGVQGSPGALLETKLVPVQVIQQNIAQGEATRVVFDRNVPLFGRGFYVGIELDYAPGDTVALITTREGESTAVTAWERDSLNTWQSYSISRGQSVAHDVTALVGMNPSVQISSSSIFINAGESVTLNARGASLFSWGPDNSGLSTNLGPQVVVTPTQTTTYTVTGSGLELCNNSASFTVFVIGTVTSNPPAVEASQLIVSPNPSQGQVKLSLSNTARGAVQIGVRNVLGHQVLEADGVKTADEFEQTIDLNRLPGGTYIVSFSMGQQVIRKKIIKL